MQSGTYSAGVALPWATWTCQARLQPHFENMNKAPDQLRYIQKFCCPSFQSSAWPRPAHTTFTNFLFSPICSTKASCPPTTPPTHTHKHTHFFLGSGDRAFSVTGESSEMFSLQTSALLQRWRCLKDASNTICFPLPATFADFAHFCYVPAVHVKYSQLTSKRNVNLKFYSEFTGSHFIYVE